ncbi:MAG: hypothetical protein WBO25_08505 [Acidimicrobiia bacterium]
MNDVETRLHNTLQSVATNTDIEDRLPEVLAHTARARYSRDRLLVGAAAFVVVVGGLGAALFVSRAADLTASETANSPHTVTKEPPTVSDAAPPMTPNGDPWPLPRLSLDAGQLDYEVSLASVATEFTAADAALAKPSPYLQVLRRDADAFKPPMIWIETNEHGSDYVRSGQAREELIFSGEYTINGAEFVLLEDGDRRVLVAELPSGTSVYVTGLGVEAADLVDFAGQLVDAAPESGMTVPEPPLDMQVVFEGRIPGIYDPPGYAQQIAAWQLGATGADSPTDDLDGWVEFLVESRGEASFEQRLYETAGQAVDQTLVGTDMVRGRLGAIVNAGGTNVAVWRETDEATGFLAVSPSELPLEAFLIALIEVDEATWQAMEDESAATRSSTTTTTPPTTPDNEPNG